jgi:large subunit ribosomal protein L21
MGNGQWEAGGPGNKHGSGIGRGLGGVRLQSGNTCYFWILGPFFALLLSFFPQFPYLCSPNVYFMLAVVKIAGQQFKVQKDQTLYVPRIAGNAGDKVEFGEVLLSHDKDDLAFGKNVKAVIKAEIIDHVQGDKVIAFKMKRRKGYRKKHGHRTHYTKIRISEIS